MRGIVAYGAYVPFHRLDRRAIAASLGAGGGKGARAVAGYDEDTTSMGVEAARACLATVPGTVPDAVHFATTAPAYLDKTNATAIHAALAMPARSVAFDMVGSVRSGMAALLTALQVRGHTLVVLSDTRTGLPGGADEREGGDGAAAILVGDDGDGPPVLAELVGSAHTTAEFLDRWRTPGDTASKVWEERFGEHAYAPLADEAVTAALKSANLTADQLDHVVVTGVHARAARSVRAAIGARPDAQADDLAATVGNTGVVQLGLNLADVLDRAEPGQTILAVLLADGADVLVLRTTDALVGYQRAPTVADQVAAGNTDLSYASYLTWKGQLHREPPRRPDPARPAGPPSLRSEHWKFAFTGSRCTNCGTRHLPPARVCVQCHAVDQTEPERLADVPATIATYTVDRLAFSLSPPVVGAVIDFDGGGRFQCELTDVDPASVRIGDRVEMTFRRLFTADGVHDYFWKARPIRSTTPTEV